MFRVIKYGPAVINIIPGGRITEAGLRRAEEIQAG